jgi:hypothetical protein
VIQLRGDGDAFKVTSILKTESGLDSFAAQDADGDGKLDLTILTDEGLRVLRARAGRDAPSYLIKVGQLDCEFWTSQYAFVQADADPEPELVTNCFGDLSAFANPPEAGLSDFSDIKPELRTYDVDLAEGRLSRLSTGLGANTSDFVTGDFNGDGVQDLAGGQPDLTVMFGIPR